jgi:hypothetical protein
MFRDGHDRGFVGEEQDRLRIETAAGWSISKNAAVSNGSKETNEGYWS